MKIVGIERFPITLQPAGHDIMSSDSLPVQTIIIILRTDTGLAGLGEAPVSSSDDSRTLPALLSWLNVYESVLVGTDSLNINAAHYLLDRASGQHPPGCQMARAAVDMALHDIIGKTRGCPVHEILGGAYRTKMELSFRIDVESGAEAANLARVAINQGYRALKIGIGDQVLPPVQSISQLDKKCRLLLAVLEAAGADICVDADANQSLGNPALVSRMFEEVLAKRFYANLALQQPLHKLDLSGHAVLREKLPIPVVLSESVVSAEAVMQIERLGAADRIGLSIERVGGLRSAMRIADICEASAIGISPTVTSYTGIGFAAHCHFAAALHDPHPIDVSTCQSFSESPVVGGPEIRDGHARLRIAPGLGVQLDENLLHSMVTGGSSLRIQ